MPLTTVSIIFSKISYKANGFLLKWPEVNNSYLWDLKSKAVESTRQKKVSRLIQKEIANIFLRKWNKFAPGKIISITKVRISPDLSYARIYLSIFPSTDSQNILQAIQDNTSKIRFDLGHNIRTQLRIVPDIAFFIDDSLDYIDKIDRLLKSWSWCNTNQ